MNDVKVSTLFKYIGGKSWLRDHLRSNIHYLLSKTHPSYYIEPFAGGLGAFLSVYDILIKHDVKNVILNDINEHIISFYQLVLSDPNALIISYMKLEAKYQKTIPSLGDLETNKLKNKVAIKELLIDANEYYKKIRASYNQLKKKNAQKHADIINISSHLLFLQNHSFNGIYRENANGEHNTPYNWDAKIFTKEKITEKIMGVHDIFKLFNMQFSIGSYKHIDYHLPALYYLDPPYLNEVVTNENKYHKELFALHEQQDLIEKISQSTFLYSNHHSPFLLNIFNNHIEKNKDAFIVNKIPRKNVISSSVESRKTDKIEMLIRYIFKSS